METPEAYQQAEALERALGDPFHPDTLLGFARTVPLDDREELPSEQLAALVAAGFPEALVPHACGGTLRTLEGMVAVMRAVARRDLTCALAFGTGVLGALPVWIWGSERARLSLSRLVRKGGLGGFAISEEGHGSDLHANRCRATREAAGYRLDGEKWPIGNATRGEYLSVLARTGDGTPPDFSIFFLLKKDLPQGSFEPLPKVKTLGLRAHDLSGIRFSGCPVPAGALIGAQGAGVDQTLKVLQVTRIMIAGLSLGAADTALRIALRWARERVLYGRPILELPPVREALAGGFADLLACEAMAVAAARGLQVCAGQLSLWSAVVKYWVPVACERIIHAASLVLGARFYLREGVAHGAFQKLMRDQSIHSVFDGTTWVNLQAIAGQLPSWAGSRQKVSPAAGLAESLFDLSAPTPDWAPEQADLRLTSLGQDAVTAGLPAAIARLRRGHPRAAALGEQVAAWLDAIARRASSPGRPGEELEVARQLCAAWGACASLELLAHWADRRPGPFAEGHWAALAVSRLLGAPASAEEVEGGLRWMIELDAGAFAFSPVPLKLG